jgi:hypothetical protein
MASPLPKIKLGDKTVVMVQASDPTEKYKGQAQEAHKVLHEAVYELRRCMQADLGNT